MKELDVNLKRAFFTERTGIAYLRENDGVDLILVSSIAGFKESPALTPYLASKHRIIGILRGIRLTAIKGSIRASTICPRMTSESLKTSVLVISTKADVMADAETVMVKGVQKDWEELKLPTNELSEVVNSFLICATPNRGSSGSSHPGAKLHSHGASYTRRAELEPGWLGQENRTALGKGASMSARPRNILGSLISAKNWTARTRLSADDIVIVLGVLGAIGHLAGMLAKNVFHAQVIGVDLAGKAEDNSALLESACDVFVPAPVISSSS
ncbi:hypothetical protein EDD36DRAFT_489517 [Exophiala viscosa]|uniref:Uncharacterized protein n=1 Tax=Exophiala viscosa TaxID=2486360 RepID=A0AAN6DTR3_9EURO|nr:hypothetical protein EDD36DRAFT_489517 [Exophiala viscosa]